jgi:hypothetical protein
MTDATFATVMDAVFAMDAYQHDPGADAPWVRITVTVHLTSRQPAVVPLYDVSSQSSALSP